MARTNAVKNGISAAKPVLTEVEAPADSTEDLELEEVAVLEADKAPVDVAPPPPVEATAAPAQDIDELINALKALLTAVEKLQKVRQEVGDIKPLIMRMLDGELVVGDELEQLKTGVAGLFKLTRAYSDHQAALAKAQPARMLLDDVLKVRDANQSPRSQEN